ncbi:hypothetical protein FsymDg_4113 [Candidatus Protofrankia datiscae]|uniref:Uncharacterized protein n=1 Tax=Candidatus Protofrankia datiscae TaxID=2716812 RepID=F8AW58_9ACTN|nr:hypothetical protein FsymDg_4113 [Candidatus Protofrankia datiscae]
MQDNWYHMTGTERLAPGYRHRATGTGRLVPDD